MTLYSVSETEALRRKYPQAFRSTPPMLAGTVIPAYVRCGKPSCRCAGGQMHGPYFYYTRRAGKRLRKTYVPQSELPSVVAMCLNRQTVQAMTRESHRRADDFLKSVKAQVRQQEGRR